MKKFYYKIVYVGGSCSAFTDKDTFQRVLNLAFCNDGLFRLVRN